MHSTQKILSLFAILLCFELHPSWGQEAPDFVAIGRPFLEKHCIGCHGSEEPKAELSLNRFQDSMSLVRERKLWENVLKMTASGEMPPEDHPRPTPAESEAFIEHVHALFDHADRNAKPDPGRVTMRRLNRVEYRNTIRDLIGIDFDPTEDFPSDDIGHGFDNIGDVLTLSPVLMERYLAAAERIVERAIMPELPPTLKRHISARHTEPASGDVEKKLMEGEFRRMTSDGTLPIEVGPINTPYQWDSEGEYTFKTRAYAKSDEDQAVRIAIVVQGKGLTESSSEEELAQLVGKVRSPAKILQILEVSGRDSKSANVFKVSLPAMEGRDRMMVALMKPNEGSPPIQVYVDHLAYRRTNGYSARESTTIARQG